MRSTAFRVFLGALALSLAAATPVLAQKGGQSDPPISLTLLVQDAPGRQSEPAARDLERLAADVSNGSVTIDFAFDGGDVASAVRDGTADLGMLPSREWDAAGVTSLDFVEAPFLIHDDALAVAVATSDIAATAMDGLASIGVTGLAMWPEDLRHLFGLGPSGAVFQTPEDVAGATILVVAGTPGKEFIKQLGGTVYEEGAASGDLTGDRFVDTESGAIDGMVTGLWGAGLPTDDVTVAGDVVVYAKYQMLVANSGALANLTQGQRDALDQAVAGMHGAALARHFTEAELAVERCSEGGTVIEAGPDALAAFRAAEQPLRDSLAADPVTRGLMADVEALDAAIPDAPGAGTCERGAMPSPSRGPSTGFVGTPPPHGSYRVTVTQSDLLAAGARDRFAGINGGTWTWSFSGGWWSADHDVRNEHCWGTYRSEGDVVRFLDEPFGSCSLGYDLQWQSDGDGIRIHVIGLNWDPNASEADLNDERSVLDRVWTRLGDAPAPQPDGFTGDEPPPDGTYRVELVQDDMLARGAQNEFAGVNAGIWTLQLADGAWSLAGDARAEKCSGTYKATGGVIRFSTDPIGTCSFDGDLRWREAGTGIRLQFVTLAGLSAADIQDNRAANEGVWERIE